MRFYVPTEVMKCLQAIVLFSDIEKNNLGIFFLNSQPFWFFVINVFFDLMTMAIPL